MLFSCGSEGSTSQSFSSVKENIENKFGSDAYFSELSVTHNESIGYIINVMTTNDPESNKMAEWTYSNGDWTQTSDVSLEVPDGYSAEDFMYKLTGYITLEKLEELIEKAKTHLAKEKGIKESKLALAAIKYPEVAEGAEAEFLINLEPDTGGTTFSYLYNLSGELIEMDY
jgi:hypothetical protein